jgi:hypothetical protein
MSAIIGSVSETLKNKGCYTLKDKVMIFTEKKNILGMHKSKKFKIEDSKAIDDFVTKNGHVVGVAFYSEKGALQYWEGEPNTFYIHDTIEGSRYHPTEANIRGVMVIKI